MPFSISPLPNRLPIGPCPAFHGPSVFQSNSFWDIWDLSASLSFHVALGFQWVLSLIGLLSNELQTRLPKPEQHFSSPSKDKAYQLYDLQAKSFSQLPLLPDSFGFLRGTGLLHLACCELSRLWCHDHSPCFVLLSMQDKTEEKFFFQRLRTSSAGSNSPSPGLSCIPSLSARHLCTTYSFLISDPDLGVWPDCWVSVEFFRALMPQKGRAAPLSPQML